MSKVLFKELMHNIYNLKDVSTLSVGPMSTNVIRACFEMAQEHNFPLIFIASRNQIDLKKYGGGYVNGWDQFDFVNNIKQIAQEINFYDFYICRDHGGPWQRDEERNAHLPIDQAMAIAQESFTADIKAGFDMIMVDPTKDPFVSGKVVPMDFVLDKTVELIEFCENQRKTLGIREISYEVGTEETNGGLTSTEEYDFFLTELKNCLNKLNLPLPIFAVGQTGTLVKSTIQAGRFNFTNAKKLSAMAIKHKVFLKEHNADYLDDASLLQHIPARVFATNVAPQFGTEETRGYLVLCSIEDVLFKHKIITKKSNLHNILLNKAIKTKRWKKWVVSEHISRLSFDVIKQDKVLSDEILQIAGHYVLNDESVKKEIKTLFKNLDKAYIDGERYIINRIKNSVRQFVECFNLHNSLKRAKN